MDASLSTFSHWNEGTWGLQTAHIGPQDTNEVHYLSCRLKEIVKELKGLPVCEIRQLPDWHKRFHLIVDPKAQKLIQKFHRYGYRPGKEQKSQCPFHGGDLRGRFIPMIGENNLFTTYKEESEPYREILLSFFNDKSRVEEFSKKWKTIVQQWMDKQIKKGEGELFESVLSLAGRCLIQGILGYEECSEEDVELNRKFWKNLLAPMPNELKPLEVLKAEGEPAIFGSTWLGNVWKMVQNISSITDKLWTYNVEGSRIFELADKILEATIKKKGTLCYYLNSEGQHRQEILENLRGLLLAGQETTGYTLACLLYEYAKGARMQDVRQAYKEILRLYPVGGALREAGQDLVLTYPDPQDATKQKNHYIRKGDLINCYGYLFGHDDAIWGETTEQFDSERSDLDSIKAAIFPFGYGVHRCVGEKTAEQEIILLATEILSKVKLSTEEKVEDFIDAFTLRPLNDIKVKFTIADRDLS